MKSIYTLFVKIYNLILLVCLAVQSCETMSDGVNLPVQMPFTSKAKKKAIKEAAELKIQQENARLAKVKAAKLKALKAKKAAAKRKATPKRGALASYRGVASWYSIRTNNRSTKTASGRPLRNNAYTAAHKTLPLGSKVRVKCLFNGKSEILTITDRGPYVKGRIIDLTIGSAKRLGFYNRGVTKVQVDVLSYGKWKYRKPSSL